MAETKIDVDFKSIDWIVHLADIHIRNLKRHKEYAEVFESVYSIIKKYKGNGVIYVGGDVVHAKTQMSPELVEQTSTFLRTLSDIAPTIVIAGNHDANLNNKNRLDALSPIINNLNHPNLHYLINSGIYHIADVSFVVMSIFDKPSKYIRAKDVTGKTKIALFHGTVSRAKTDFGFKLQSDIKINKFSGYDLALLGDIHKHQFLNRKKTVAYCGSLLSQNYGEALNKGFIKWDVKNKTGEFVKVYNPYGYYTLDINAGEVPIVTDMPEKARLRLRVSNTTAAQLKLALSKIRKKYGITEVNVNRVDSLSKSRIGNRENKINIGDISNPEYQFSLIEDYLKRNYIIDDDTLTEIRTINKEINFNLPEEEISRNVFWVLKTFEFDNMFSYGEGNKIDFTKIEGINGLFAGNSQGKSSLLDAILFCLFDTTSRTFKATKILNNQKSSFRCKIKFEINDIDYYIERKAKKLKNGHVKVDVNFWTIDDAGEKISLNGDQRRSTDSNIRKIIGSYEDFVLTSLSLQNNFTVFIDKTQKERKELLAQFMGMGIFDRLYTTAHDEISEVSVILKDFRKRDYDKELIDIDNNSKIYKTEYDELKEKKKSLTKIEKDKNREMLTLSKTLKSIDNSIVDVESLDFNKKSLEDTLDLSISGIKSLHSKRAETVEEINRLKLIISKYISQDITTQYNELLQYENDKAKTVVEIDKLKIDVQHKLKKMETLKNLEYDPNCSYCMNNIFVKDAIQTKSDLEQDKQLARKYLEKKENLDNIIERMFEVRSEKEKYDIYTQELLDLQRVINDCDSKIEITTEKIKNLKNNINLYDEKISKYYEQEQDILFNKDIEIKIDDLTNQIDDISYQIDVLDKKIQTVHGQLKVFDSSRSFILNTISKVEKLERKYHAYEYYLDAIKRDGVPYELIEKSLPTIESEVNNILTQIVDFGIVLEMDGKNINTYIAYDEDSIWPLELCGGMERFISSLALRVGLINVCNLPRSNFLAIDEGWSNLDTDNINSVYMLFQYLKTQFQFVMIISHIEHMRDAVDSIIDINKINGYSSIVCV